MPEIPAGGAQIKVNGGDNAYDPITLNGAASPPLPELCAQIHAKVDAFLNRPTGDDRVLAVQKRCRESLDVIEEALHTYSLDELSLSYNGGKDCLVLLILYLYALHGHFANDASATITPPSNATTNTQTTALNLQLPNKLKSVYIVSSHPFPAVDTFVNLSESHYHLSLSRYAKKMQEAFTDYLHVEPSIRAIFVGTRRTDPHGSKLKFFDPTDRGWPSFVRIHPVLEWRYADIWGFIRGVGVDYCCLYDMGYTSLGGTTDTFRNPALKIDGVDGSGAGDGKGLDQQDGTEERYRPAYELVEDDAERLGREIVIGPSQGVGDP